MLADLEELAERNRWRLVRMRFGEPEDLSPVVADLYRSWYRRRGLPGDRLLVESFLLMEPWRALRSGSVPYRMVFNARGRGVPHRTGRAGVAGLTPCRNAGGPPAPGRASG
ncbi:hypothetical protein [Nonomuraea jabiensis]|uniref:hypothetical protein n=1 Tax=Nonomuraea jabiensis TaxID=882448 RepID=UPI003690EC8C